jgi:hypothetical protein
MTIDADVLKPFHGIAGEEIAFLTVEPIILLFILLFPE